MAAKLPYLISPGTLSTAFTRVKTAAVPPTANYDFVSAKLQLKGGTGRAIPPFLKKINFAASDGTPTKLYERFRNSNPAVSGDAVAQAMRYGYKPLYEVNEYAHELSDKDLKGLMVQVTGLEEKDRTVELAHATFKKLREFAQFDVDIEEEADSEAQGGEKRERLHFDRRLAVGYTINLNLPPSTNIEVFNAIFKSLRDNLLRDD